MTLNLQDCTTVNSLLDAYHDGELAGDEKASVEMHLRACDVCPQRLAEIGRLVTMLKTMPVLSSKIDFADRFQIPAASSLPLSSASSNKVIPGKFGRAAAIAAAVALCLGFGQYVLRHNMSGSEIANLQPVNSTGVNTVRTGNSMSGNQVSKTLQMEQLASKVDEAAPPSEQGGARETPAIPATPDTGNQTENKAPAKKEARVKPPVIRVANNLKTQDAVNTSLASALPPAKENEGVSSGDGIKHSLVAYYELDPNTIPEELGISTDEDGLYAIKM